MAVRRTDGPLLVGVLTGTLVPNKVRRYASKNADWRDRQPMETVEDVVGSLDTLMGLKVVWGRSREAVMCFAKRGVRPEVELSTAQRVAERAQDRPWFVTIGGGGNVPKELKGRALELVRATSVYGPTETIVQADDLRERLRQWPAAIILSEVYAVAGEPRLVEDLGLPDRGLLVNAHDRVRRDEDRLPAFWDAIRGREVRRRADVRRPPGFRDPLTIHRCDSDYPRLTGGSLEGRRVLRAVRALERRRSVSRAVKAVNRKRNGGDLVCEACDMRGDREVMFDAHHLDPLCRGLRWSKVDSFALLCPTCHRWAHHMVSDPLVPMPIAILRQARSLTV